MVEVYKLCPRSSFHFGLRGVGVEATGVTGPSDTVFSALCLMVRDLRGVAGLEEFLGPFLKDDPPFLLSSAFPYAGDLLLFPRPWLRVLWNGKGEQDTRQAKLLKKVRFVSHNIFQAILRSEPLQQEFIEANLLQKGRVWVTSQERSRLPARLRKTGRVWVKHSVPRVTVDWATGTSSVYQAGYVRFQPGCGLYLLFRWRRTPDGLPDLVEEALRALGDVGIGGERSAGHGQFKLDGPQTLTLEGPATASRFVTLALYHPTEAEVKAVLGKASAYELEPRRGWMASPDEGARRRQPIFMLSAGSVLSDWQADRVYGDLADVTPLKTKTWSPPHRVYRYGFAFPVAAAGAQEEDGS